MNILTKRTSVVLSVLISIVLGASSAQALSTFTKIGLVLRGVKITYKIANATDEEGYDKQMFISTNTKLDGYDGYIERDDRDAIGLLNLHISEEILRALPEALLPELLPLLEKSF